MWPFLRKKSETSSPKIEAPHRSQTLETLLQDMGDPGDFAHNNVAVKFWLPESVNEALFELSNTYDESVSVLLRKVLATHCYGIYPFGLLRGQKPKLFEDENYRYSRKYDPKKRGTAYFIPELGKSVAPIKLWIPERLKRDLETLAGHVSLKLSHYLREIIISRLFGHGTLPLRPEMMEAFPTRAAEDWGDDLDVPWREISEQEYKSINGSRITETEVD